MAWTSRFLRRLRPLHTAYPTLFTRAVEAVRPSRTPVSAATGGSPCAGVARPGDDLGDIWQSQADR